jgi:alkaline phosphatase D
LKYRASRDRSMKVLQPLLSKMPQYAIWDDHDYGPNDANGSYILKDSSRNIFMNYTTNPSYGEDGKGIYTKVSFSDADIFLTDNRYFRSSDRLMDTIDGQPADKSFFGKQQMDWLKNALLISRATFKIIACGSQILNPVSRFESMRMFSSEYNDLMHFLQLHNITGVLFLTGDRHHSEIIKVPHPLYPLYDITVSPLTAGVGRISGAEVNNPFRLEGSLVLEQNYGRISISGDKGKRVFKIEYLGISGNKLYEWQIAEDALKPFKN